MKDSLNDPAKQPSKSETEPTKKPEDTPSSDDEWERICLGAFTSSDRSLGEMRQILSEYESDDTRDVRMEDDGTFTGLVRKETDLSSATTSRAGYQLAQDPAGECAHCVWGAQALELGVQENQRWRFSMGVFKVVAFAANDEAELTVELEMEHSGTRRIILGVPVEILVADGTLLPPLAPSKAKRKQNAKAARRSRRRNRSLN